MSPVVRRLAPLGAVAAAALLVAAPLAGPARAQDDAGDRVVATVNGTEITMAEVQEAISSLPQQVRQMPRQSLIPAVANQLAVGKLMAEQGYESGLADDPEVERRLSAAEETIVQEVWLDRQVEERIDEAAIEEEYQAYLEANPSGPEVKARHILVETEEAARDLIGQLEEGADFADLARENSVGPSAQNGGDLGWFAQGDMVAPFAEAAFALETDAYTQEPVETQFGWHVILTEDKRESEPPTLAEIRGQLEQQLTRQAVQSIVDDVRADAEIVLYGPDGEPLEAPPAGAGGGN
ncbi:MAG: peptidylprolyl isomerase [Azospirillaceae bacterium]